MKWFIKVLRQYADFDGRASREEYWMYILYYFLFLLLFSYHPEKKQQNLLRWIAHLLSGRGSVVPLRLEYFVSVLDAVAAFVFVDRDLLALI